MRKRSKGSGVEASDYLRSAKEHIKSITQQLGVLQAAIVMAEKHVGVKYDAEVNDVAMRISMAIDHILTNTNIDSKIVAAALRQLARELG